MVDTVKILLVLDEIIEAIDIKQNLESFGYEVPYVAADGKEAIKKALEIAPDLILMDIILKGETNGIEVAFKIKNLNIPIIYLTAHSDESTIEKANHTGPYGYIIKPYDVTELKYAIELALYKHKTEIKLKESEKQYRSILENIQDAYVRVNKEGYVIMVSHSAVSMFGFYSPQEMIGIHSVSFYKNPERRTMMLEYLKKQNHVEDFEGEVLRKNGTSFWVSINIQFIYDDEGQIQGTEAFIRDITQRKKAERELFESEERLKLTLTAVNDGIWDWNIPTGEAVLSPNLYTNLGYEPYEFPQNLESWRKLIHPDDIERVLKDLGDKIARGEGFNVELRYKTKSGDWRWILGRGMVVERDEKNNPIRMVGTDSDITVRKEMEESLAASEKKYRTLFETDPDYTILLSTDGYLVDVNRAAMDITGLSRNELVGKHFTDLKIFPEKEMQLNLKYFSSFSKGKDLTPFESSIYDYKGNIRFIEIKNTFIEIDDKINYILLICSDITHRKKVEDEIKSSLKEKEVLLHEIHHRVKNNMQIISSLLNLQKQYVDDEETVKILIESQNRVKSMAMIHEKLYQSDNLTDIRFDDYIERLVSDLFYSYNIPKDQIKMVLEVEEVELNMETAIPCGLILSEIVTNSLKHAFPHGRKGEVHVSLKLHNNRYELIIGDNGVGLPNDLNFKNTDSLGLQLVNSLVSQIDGEIELDRSQGTELKIIFNELEYKERL